MNIAIILASGMGKRMKARKNKTLLDLEGKPVIYHTIQVFEKTPRVNRIILVVRQEEIEEFKQIVRKNKFKKIMAVIAGGDQRQDSGYNAVRFAGAAVKNKNNLILIIHNGANPFVTKKEIQETVKFAKKFGACAVAHKTKDTIRQVDKRGMSVGIIDRSALWNMQTPQTIRYSLAKRAFEKAKRENYLGTDDIALVERLGKKAKIIEASENNFKITTPPDLELAKLIIKKQ